MFVIKDHHSFDDKICKASLVIPLCYNFLLVMAIFVRNTVASDMMTFHEFVVYTLFKGTNDILIFITDLQNES